MDGRTHPVVVVLTVAALALAVVLACDGEDSAVFDQHSDRTREVQPALVRPPLRALDPSLPAELVVKFRDAAGARRLADATVAQAALALRPVAGRNATKPLFWTSTVANPALDPDALRALAEALRLDPAVEFVTIRSPPPPPLDLAPVTPDYVGEQGYLNAEGGIDAVGAWALGFDGAGVRIADVEYGWNGEHEEFNERDLHPEPGQTVAEEALAKDYAPDHGTAALGVVVGDPGGYGVRGIAPGVEIFTYPEWTVESGFRRAEAIANAASGLRAGDVLMLEMQVGDPTLGSFGPAELDQDVWLLTREATDAGIVVVAASGNGGLDLDAPTLADYRDRGDSGAIIVAAADPQTQEPSPYSTFGARIDLHAWGAGVFTSGYGDFSMLGNDENQAYTADFQGSSAAAPMVAAAAALVQQAAMSVGEPLSPTRVREILVATGSPQGPGPNIGSLPRIAAAVAIAMAPEAQAPSVAIVVPPEDFEIEVPIGALYETEIKIEADDDSGYIYSVELLLNGEPASVPDKSAPFAYPTAGFGAGTWELVAVATDAWGNRAQSAPRRFVVAEAESTASTGANATGGEDDSSGGVGSDAGPEEGTGTDTDTDDPSSSATTAGGCGCGPNRHPQPPTAACVLVLVGCFTPRRRR